MNSLKDDSKPIKLNSLLGSLGPQMAPLASIGPMGPIEPLGPLDSPAPHQIVDRVNLNKPTYVLCAHCEVMFVDIVC